MIRITRLLRYLQGSKHFDIIYKSNYECGILEGYSDADHSGDNLSGRSTSDVLCLFAGEPVTWLNQRQTSVAISTTKAEVVAASKAAREIFWFKCLFHELANFTSLAELQVDNEAAIGISKNPEYHRRTKHIRISHFFIRELVVEEEIFQNQDYNG